MKNLLIVDDEVEIVNALSDYFVDRGFAVHKSHSAEQALQIYKDKKPDLVLSDIRMPGRNGMELYNDCMQSSNESSVKTPFVLMTGFADTSSVETAFKNGISELIAKPFDMDSINIVVNYLLKTDESYGQDKRYFSIPIEEFMLSRNNAYNIYLKIGERYVLVTRCGQEFTEHRIANFAKKGVNCVYLAAEDFAKYTDMQFSIANMISSRPLEVARKTKLLNHLLGSVGQLAIFKDVDQALVERSLMAFENYTQLSINNFQINTVLSQLLLAAPDITERSALRAVVCTMITNMWKWNSPKVQSRLILGSLLCDVSLKNYTDILSKKYEDFTNEDHKIYSSHPLESYKILSQVPQIPEDVLVVVLQHHENSAGLGFPQKLTRDKLHSFSKIVQCVEEFLEVLLRKPEDQRDIQQALEHMYVAKSKMYSDQVLKTLYMIFKTPMPKRLESVLLPDRTMRVI